MSELPSELRSLLADSKRAHEPDAARLAAVRARMELGAPVQPEFDVAPPKLSVVRPWLLPGVCTLLLGALGVWLWPAASAPGVQTPAVQTPEVLTPAVQTPAVQTPAMQAPAVHAPTVSAPQAPGVPPARVQTPARQPAPAALAGPSGPAPQRHDEAHVQAPRRARTAPLSSKPVVRREEPTGDWPVVAPSSEPPSTATAAVEAPPGFQPVETRKRAPASSATLQSEVQLISRAQRALALGDWAAAERALSEHQLEHPAGQLQTERTALRVRARCLAVDLSSARRLHAQLELLAPGSALLRNVERACPQLAP